MVFCNCSVFFNSISESFKEIFSLYIQKYSTYKKVSFSIKCLSKHSQQIDKDTNDCYLKGSLKSSF